MLKKAKINHLNIKILNFNNLLNYNLELNIISMEKIVKLK